MMEERRNVLRFSLLESGVGTFQDRYEPFADTGKWQIIIFSKNCLRRLTGPYHPQ